MSSTDSVVHGGGRASFDSSLAVNPATTTIATASSSAFDSNVNVSASSPRPPSGSNSTTRFGSNNATRPASDLLQPTATSSFNNNSNKYNSLAHSPYLNQQQARNPEWWTYALTCFALSYQRDDDPIAEAIDRWFEDLQQYEQTLEDMAAASLDANFKEELTAIEQWFRVLSEAERTAALYSLLQSSTQVQVRFFVTVLQQMARADPMNQGLLSPANPSQQSMEAQMETRLASMSLKSPASPAVRQFARQSLGNPSSSSDAYLSPHSASEQQQRASPPSPVMVTDEGQTTTGAASTLANQRAKLKANARTSAPATLHHLNVAGGGAYDKSPLWSEKETLVERRTPSPGARPRSTEPESVARSNTGNQYLSHSTGPSSTASFLRSPGLDYNDQLSPMVGGSWASMVNTPLVPMFAGKNGQEPGSTMPQGDYGDGAVGLLGAGAALQAGLRSPMLDTANSRLNSWSSQRDQGSQQQHLKSPGGIVLDDARKFRRSARIGPGAFGGGALGGMYDEREQQQHQSRLSASQQQQHDNLRRAQLSTMQQNAINLGLANLPPVSSTGPSQRNPNGSLNSPGLQQTAMAAQQNWRNGLNSPNSLGSMTQDRDHQLSTQAAVNMSAINANAQLANLVALQQQVLQQQQQLNNSMAAAGLNLSPVQLLGLQQQQALLSPGRLVNNGAVGGMGMGFGNPNVNLGLGMNGLGSPRRSPRASDRSPGGNNYQSNVSSNSKVNLNTSAGSGANPDEPLDMSLLEDIPAWLRSLRLHKYTPNFEDSTWQEMIQLDDAALDAKGVTALGARRKLLKVFETVRIKTGNELPGDGAASSEALSSRDVNAGGSPDGSVSPGPASPDVEGQA
ncbi:Flap-structured DNA-binding and RNA-binding protein [Microbotryomycetes sp. JL221]|nr:Flap-structured DNA-binding and RNA-binding protein [Microbotryomycetes sp. JL221]